ncbi:MAG TPA: hypothetical protein ENH94_04875 [Phycisphaerales bacterium]|nr:hypothetical protein [Phycisphaerales bacterium]
MAKTTKTKTQAEQIARLGVSAKIAGNVVFLKCGKCGYVLLSEERECPHCYADDAGSLEVVERPKKFVDAHRFREWEKLKNDGR